MAKLQPEKVARKSKAILLLKFLLWESLLAKWLIFLGLSTIIGITFSNYVLRIHFVNDPIGFILAVVFFGAIGATVVLLIWAAIEYFIEETIKEWKQYKEKNR